MQFLDDATSFIARSVKNRQSVWCCHAGFFVYMSLFKNIFNLLTLKAQEKSNSADEWWNKLICVSSKVTVGKCKHLAVFFNLSIFLLYYDKYANYHVNSKDRLTYILQVWKYAIYFIMNTFQSSCI